MAKKYIKNEKGIVKSITTDNLQLEKPLLNENYDIEVHNRNMDKIDNAIQEVKGQVSGLELKAEKVTIADTKGLFEATNVEDALLENKTSILDNTNLANQALIKANEAFQRGDNVKTQLVDKLISEGLDVSTNNTFEELIGSITLGKKWAKGEDTLVYSGGGVFRSYSQTISNLDFVPSLVFCYCEHLFGDNSANYLKGAVTSNLGYLSMYTANSLATVTISNNSFTFNVSTQGTVGSLSFTWYAFE